MLSGQEALADQSGSWKSAVLPSHLLTTANDHRSLSTGHLKATSRGSDHIEHINRLLSHVGPLTCEFHSFSFPNTMLTSPLDDLEIQSRDPQEMGSLRHV